MVVTAIDDINVMAFHGSSLSCSVYVMKSYKHINTIAVMRIVVCICKKTLLGLACVVCDFYFMFFLDRFKSKLTNTKTFTNFNRSDELDDRTMKTDRNTQSIEEQV